MPNPARRLARKYLPEPLRRAAVERLRAAAAPSTPAPSGRAKPAPAAAPEPLVELLRTGRSFEEAVVAQVRSCLADGRGGLAVALATSLSQQAATHPVGALAEALVAARRGYPELAWRAFAEVPAELWAVHAADEWVRTGLLVEPEQTLATVRELAGRADAPVAADGWLALVGPVFAHGDEELTRALYTRLDQAVGDGSTVGDDLVVQRDWLRPWVAASGDSPQGTAPDGQVSFAVMDYGHPGRNRASANIGDHVQSLASLGHLARHQKLTFDGQADLVELLQQLHGRVRPEMARDEVEATVNLVAVDRDASMYNEVPPNTWTLGFGWFMHPMFEIRYGFPFHENLLPIFVSFHCNHRGLLSPEAVDYLKKFGPIGCRDWTTVDILLSVGVPAFFSGCMTTTVSTVFPEIPEKPAADAPVAYVDVPDSVVPSGAPTYRHSYDEVRFRSFAHNVYDAIDLLETYRRKHSGLVTSRLHCYLPGRSIGCPVDFQPKNRSDIRFAGLIDITDGEFDAIRDGISAKLEKVMSAALSGQEPEQVYALWRELTAGDVEAARRRHDAPAKVAPARADLTAGLARAVAATQGPPASEDASGTVHVGVHVPRGTLGGDALAVLATSVVRSTESPVHLWLLGRVDPAQADGLRAALPGTPVSVVPTAGLGADLRRVGGSKPAPRDVDLTALPELLPGVDRLVLLPADALVTGDVAELAAIDLAGHVLAAPTVPGTKGTSGFSVLHAAGNRLGPETVAAAELRRQGHQRHAFDFDAFDVDVLVLDLAALRASGFTARAVPYVEQFGLTFKELLFLEVGPQRAVVPAAWHAMPGRTVLEGALLTHWNGPGKPWGDGVVPARDTWRAAAAAVR